MPMQAAAVAAAVATTMTPEAHNANRANYIAELNKIENLTWIAGENSRFKGMPVGAAADLCGVKEDNLKVLNEEVENVITFAADTIPESFDSVQNWPECANVIGDIRDQSNCGCCWAFGGASAASDRLCIATKGVVQVPLSAQEICFCANRNGCGGGYVNTPWDWLLNHGVATGGQNAGYGNLGGGFCSEYSLPHCHHHGPQGDDPFPAEGTTGCPSQRSPECPTACDSSADAIHSDFKTDRYTFDGKTSRYTGVQAIQTAIMTDGPVEAAFTVYEDFENYVSGIYQRTSLRSLGGHAIRIVGWGSEGGVDYWKVANSWNPYWGEQGYFRIVRGVNECGIEGQVTASSTGANWRLMNQQSEPAFE